MGWEGGRVVQNALNGESVSECEWMKAIEENSR
jgi:hypothetical protein